MIYTAVHSKGRVKGRRVGAGTYSLTIDRLLVHRHGIVGTYSSAMYLATWDISIVDRAKGRRHWHSVVSIYQKLKDVCCEIDYVYIKYMPVRASIYPYSWVRHVCEEKIKPGMCSCITYAPHSGVISVPY